MPGQFREDSGNRIKFSRPGREAMGPGEPDPFLRFPFRWHSKTEFCRNRRYLWTHRKEFLRNEERRSMIIAANSLRVNCILPGNSVFSSAKGFPRSTSVPTTFFRPLIPQDLLWKTRKCSPKSDSEFRFPLESPCSFRRGRPPQELAVFHKLLYEK